MILKEKPHISGFFYLRIYERGLVTEEYTEYVYMLTTILTRASPNALQRYPLLLGTYGSSVVRNRVTYINAAYISPPPIYLD